MRRLMLFMLLLVAHPALAHVPYLEERDFTPAQPFDIERVEDSKGIYSWFQTGDDIDVFRFEVRRPVRLYAQALVPVCPGLEELRPWFAVVGPGLPAPTEELPFTIPSGYGAIVVKNLPPGVPRPTFYEPFGGKYYYDGPVFDELVTTSGTWYLYYWDPAQKGGDYTAVVGYKESFWRPADLLRSLINTPKIRRNKELHRPCPD